MKVLVSGGTGFIGSRLVQTLKGRGDEVLILSRRPGANRIEWAPPEPLCSAALDGVHAVIHLAGEPIAGGWWTQARKRRILESRTQSTEVLASALAQRSQEQARTFISASAIGWYGNRDDETLTEGSSLGSGFLAEVCAAWEAAAEPARQAKLRVVHPRIGVVLGRDGGALSTMLTPFRLGLGGMIGSGRQYMPWISIEDAVGLLVHALDNASLNGPMNVTSPQPVTNREFTRALGQALHRPTLVPLPAFGARMLMGEMANELLLSSARVLPQVATESGFAFEEKTLLPYLQKLFR